MDNTCSELTVYVSQTGLGWQIVDNGGNILDNGQTGDAIAYATRDDCWNALRTMYPMNSVWRGHASGDGGWSIRI